MPGFPEVSTWEDPTHCTKPDPEPELGWGGSGFQTVGMWGLMLIMIIMVMIIMMVTIIIMIILTIMIMIIMIEP